MKNDRKPTLRHQTYLSGLLARCHWLLAGLVIAMMAYMGVASMAKDSAIVDEVAHVPAAYSYLRYGDFRLNPEHPPLIKDLAGLPLQFMDLSFPDAPADPWNTKPNSQWDTGYQFLYHSGNDASSILFWSRLPLLMLALAFGAGLYWYVRRAFGTVAALLALVFYAFSPNILAHARYVTTDLGASATVFLALIMFVRFVRNPDRSNVILLGLVLAVAQLAKFSSVMLYPLLGALTIAVAVSCIGRVPLMTSLKRLSGGFILASVLSVGIIWAYYLPHTINTSQQTQQALIVDGLWSPKVSLLRDVIWPLAEYPAARPIVQYAIGLGMVYSRIDAGNTTYFMGQVTDQSFKAFFPVLFLLKTQLAFLLLLVSAGVLVAAVAIRKYRAGLRRMLSLLLERYLLETVLAVYVAVYFASAIFGNLNLGIRHILPIYPPLFVLVAVAIVRIGRRLRKKRLKVGWSATVGVLVVWYAVSAVAVFPSFVPYFNELAGGPAKANRYFSDSNVDWGQDLVRFKEYVEEHGLTDVGLDYFGGGQVAYYFPDSSKVREWHVDQGRFPGKYLAVSETYLENDRYFSAKAGREGYEYLRAMEPVAKIGYSIYLFKVD